MTFQTTANHTPWGRDGKQLEGWIYILVNAVFGVFCVPLYAFSNQTKTCRLYCRSTYRKMHTHTHTYIYIYIYICIYIYYQSKVFGHPQNFLFLFLKLLFLMKQVKYQNVFIYYPKYMSSQATIIQIKQKNTKTFDSSKWLTLAAIAVS